MKIWIDGAITDGSEARISVLDHGFLFGDGVFEGIRITGRRVFRLPDHLRRLGASARAVGIALPLAPDELAKLVLETARAHGRDEAYARLIATRGIGDLGVDPTKCGAPRLFCIVDDVRIFAPEVMARGLHLVTASVRRPALDALDPNVKSLNYLPSVLARREARQRGADEALVLNARGTIAEAAVANVFVARDGALRTPPVTDGALPGITRASVLEIAAALGIDAREASLGRADLFAADEVFLTGSGAGLVPVGRFDGAPIGDEDGPPPPERPILRRIREAFPSFAHARGVPF
jgi:branched-chain amino acid aminotransferase